MQTGPLTRALITLVILSLATTFLAGQMPDAGPVFVAAVLILSGLKARVILLNYLGLAQAPSFHRGFTAFLIVFLLLAYGFYMIG